MSTNIIILLTVASCIVLFGAVALTTLYLAKHKAGEAAKLDEIGKGIGYAQSIAEAVKPFLPTIAGNVIEAALKYASQAVTRVETDYKTALQTGAAGNDSRKAQATTMIQTALALEGIPMTADTQKLIDTVIPLLVLALPKTHDETTTASQVPEA